MYRNLGLNLAPPTGNKCQGKLSDLPCTGRVSPGVPAGTGVRLVASNMSQIGPKLDKSGSQNILKLFLTIVPDLSHLGPI